MWIGFLGVLVFLLVADYITEEDEAERKIKNPWIADFALYLHFPLMILLLDLLLGAFNKDLANLLRL